MAPSSLRSRRRPWRNGLKQLGATVVAPERRSSTYLQKFVIGEIDKWAAIIKAANIKPQ